MAFHRLATVAVAAGMLAAGFSQTAFAQSTDLAPATGEHWGNFSQTYSMVGLIQAAMRLSRRWEDAL